MSQEVYVKEKLKLIFSCVLILICLPYFVTYCFQGEPAKATVKTDESIEIAGILASQVPVTVEEEALKAQAVIVRTQLQWCKENKKEAPKPLSKKEMEQLWGQEKYYEFYEKMIRAAGDTNGQVMTFGGKVINPSFHKVSAGMTRDGSQIYKDTPYLLSVKSSEDVLSEDYLSVKFFTKKEFEEKLAGVLQNKEEDPKEIEAYLNTFTIKRDGAEYVTELKKDGNTIDVDAFVQAFELPSPCFFLKEMDGHIRIVIKGCGHGYGLSQYGAEDMAKNKKSYEEILKYYFSGIKTNHCNGSDSFLYVDLERLHYAAGAFK